MKYHPKYGSIDVDTELGGAMLIAEDSEGNYEPIAAVISINEARELAGDDMHRRRTRLEGDEDAGMCPEVYKVWSRNYDGEFCVAYEVEPQR